MSFAPQVESMNVKVEEYEFVRFTISDVHGIPKTRVIPARHVRQFMKEGPKICKALIFYGPSTLEYDGATCTLENVATKPDVQTLYPLPWATDGKFKVGEFLCEPYDVASGEVLAESPRAMARKQLRRLEDRGLSLLTGWEMEFILLDKASKKPISTEPRFATSAGIAELEKFLYTLSKHCEAANINIESISEEAAAGQMELCIYPTRGIAAADQVFKFKQATREIGQQFGFLATFMSMPWYPYGNGTHFNHSIIDSNDKNVLYDAKKEDKLSEIAQNWIAGILHHAKALCALSAPTVNCFRRFHLPWAPTKADWGIDDRSASLRLKNNGPKATYVENRLPSGPANPYIAMAATIAAGLDGVDKGMTCPSEEARLPDTLSQALDDLEADEVLCDALGGEFIKRYVEEKRLGEVKQFPDWTASDQSEKTMQKERDLYLELF